MSKVAEYAEYVKDVAYSGDEGPRPDDVDNVPMTYENFVGCKVQEMKDHELLERGLCNVCEQPFGSTHYHGTCVGCMDTYCEKMSGK